MRIVECGPERAEVVHRLTQAAFGPHAGLDPPSGAGRETLDLVRAELGAGGGAVAALAGRPVGCLRFQAQGRHLHVHRVAVAPGHQRRGIGRALMLWAHGAAARRGLDEVTVGVRIALPGNVAFYRGLGYEVTGEHAHAGYDRPTSVSMRLRLRPAPPSPAAPRSTLSSVAPRFRADHVGSLLRPAGLLHAREAHAQGRVDAGGLRSEEDAAILDVLSEQRRAGVEVFTDGELRRGSWITGFAAAVDGFVPQSLVVEWRGPGGGPEPSTSRSELLGEVVRIVRAEIEALIAQGVAYVQLDAPYYSPFVDAGQRARLRAGGLDPDAAVLEMVQADAAAVRGLAREGLTLGLHVCRGNSRSRWLAEGAFDPIAEPLLATVPVDAFLLEYDAERHGGFEPLRFLPAGRTAVLGLVTTKTPELESRDDLLRRIDEAARFAPPDRLALSPQCGFASVAAGNLLAEDDQWRKLELVVETARAAWG